MNTSSPKRIDVVAGLIFRDGDVLACQRHQNAAFPLKWEFPGGKVEQDEADIDALRRELKEELGVEIHEAELVRQYEYSYKDGPTVSLRFYRIHKFDGEAKNLIFQQISWVKMAELGGLDFLDGDRPIIGDLLSMGAAELVRR